MSERTPDLDKSQLGRAGELALSLYALVTSNGQVELYEPVVDDDHVDLVGAIRGGLPKIGIQVKTADTLDKNGQVEARARFRWKTSEMTRRLFTRFCCSTPCASGLPG